MRNRTIASLEETDKGSHRTVGTLPLGHLPAAVERQSGCKVQRLHSRNQLGNVVNVKNLGDG